MEEKVQIVHLPFNPDNIFTDIIQFIYSERLTITTKNMAQLYACATYYKFEKLRFIVSRLFEKSLCVENSLFLCSNLIKFGMDEGAVKIASIFANEFSKNLKGEESLLSIQQIFDCCSPRVLAEILKDPCLDFVTRNQKVQLIDQFCTNDLVLDDQNKEYLASVIDWTLKDSYKIYLSSQCDWLPSKIQRFILSDAFNARKNTLKSLSSTSNHTPRKFGNWYLLSWLTALSKGEVSEKPPEVEAIKFMTTLGISDTRYDPELFTLIRSKSSELLDQDFSPSKLFTDTGYFCSISTEETPYLEIDFGAHAGIITSEIGISCELTNDSDIPKPVPKKLVVKGFVEGNDQCLYEKVFRYAKHEAKDGIKTFPLVCDVPIRKIRISVPDVSAFGFEILRITKLTLTCSFIPA